MENEQSFIKWPGPWLDEELTDQESKDIEELTEIIAAAKADGIHADYREDGSMSDEWAAIMIKLTPFLNSFMHMTYQLAKDKSLPEWVLKDPIGATTSIIDFIINDESGNHPSEGQTSTTDNALTQEQISNQLSLFKNETPPSDLPLLQSVYAHWHVMPNNPLMNALQQKSAINAGAFDLLVSNASERRKEITAYTIISYDPTDTSLQFPGGKLSEYERQVSDAITSLWMEASNQGIPPAFTTDAIFRAMPGGSDKASPQQRGAITRTIEKFRNLHIIYNPTEELRRRGVIGDNEEWSVNDNYLYARRVMRRIKNGGQTVYAYLILAEPMILTYSKLTKQLITIDPKYLEIKKVKNGRVESETLAMTADRQAMTGYMLRRIAIMKKDMEKAKERLRTYNRKRQRDKSLEEKPLNAFKRQSHIITFLALFTETGTETTNRDKTMDNRNFCFQVLDYWKATGYIKGYQKQTKSRSITGIEIDL